MMPVGNCSYYSAATGAWSVLPGRRCWRKDCLPRALFVSECGISSLDVVFALAATVTMGALAMALTSSAIDEMRTATAARYVAGRIGSARIDAVRRATAVALRFEAVDGDHHYAPFEDGNGNGVRTAEISAGIDRPLGPSERLSDKFPGVRFELTPGVPDPDGDVSATADGVRIGSARLLTMSADGTATSGTLYVRGRQGQYAVRGTGVSPDARGCYRTRQGTEHGSAVNRSSSRYALRPVCDRGHASDPQAGLRGVARRLERGRCPHTGSPPAPARGPRPPPAAHRHAAARHRRAGAALRRRLSRFGPGCPVPRRSEV